MAIDRYKLRTGSLLSSTTRVEAPFVRISLGGYTFGVYEGKTRGVSQSGVVSVVADKYPNYIQDLSIRKINGVVNQYSLNIKYPITENNDPNFFEKLFSSVSGTRKIEITYGDFMLPEYIYKDEEAIITKVQTSFDMKGSVISYKVEATSTSSLTLSGNYMFPTKRAKPSEEIIRILYDPSYHLTDVFTGMKDRAKVMANGWIAGDDLPVTIPTCTNISALEYLQLLVDYMTPNGTVTKDSAIKPNIYAMTTYDSNDGPYFKVQKVLHASSSFNQLCTYEVDVGYQTANIITDFSIKNNENWSIYYNYNQQLGNSDYLRRIDNKGAIEYIYSPLLTNGNYSMTEADSTWWTQVTKYPVSASITLKGLLKPAVLMQYIKLNVWFYGKKHILSGYYIIKSQQDNIGLSGYTTTLELMRVGEDEDIQ